MIGKPSLIAFLSTIFIYSFTAYSETPNLNKKTPPLVNLNNTWFEQAASAIAQKDSNARKLPSPRGGAKNIILFVGDGMGITTVTAARILDGQQKGMLGEENTLSFELFEHSGFSKTYNVDAQTPDSAGTMTAIMTGIKTDSGVIGLAEGVERGNCASRSGQSLISALELAEIAGLSTGIVTTTRVTHATPAATFAESVERNWESEIPQYASKLGCEDIASQLVNFESRLDKKVGKRLTNGIDVVLGGGKSGFLPFHNAGNSNQARGSRSDGRDLIQEWKNLYPDGQYITNKKELKALRKKPKMPVLGLFNDSHMSYQQENPKREPNLTQMTQTAIELLQRNPNGFFLMVEGGRIDHAHHDGNPNRALTETIELSRAVQRAVEITNSSETLIIVTADHSHVFTIAGYPKRGNPILGKVVGVGQSKPSLSTAGLAYSTLGYTNGPGVRGLDEDVHINNSLAVKAKPLLHQNVAIPLTSETHGAEDVPIYATGPGSHLVSGTMEQNQIFHVMEFAADLIQKAKKHF